MPVLPWLFNLLLLVAIVMKLFVLGEPLTKPLSPSSLAYWRRRNEAEQQLFKVFHACPTSPTFLFTFSFIFLFCFFFSLCLFLCLFFHFFFVFFPPSLLFFFFFSFLLPHLPLFLHHLPFPPLFTMPSFPHRNVTWRQVVTLAGAWSLWVGPFPPPNSISLPPSSGTSPDKPSTG